MSNILIINIDSDRIPNLALKKIEIYHRSRGDALEFDSNLFINWADKIYISIIFTQNRERVKYYQAYGADIGGTGWDLHKVLPPEIESIKPRINLGFTSRGCIRECKFCVVPEKEGPLRPVLDLYDIWDGKARGVTLLDNNILGIPDHFDLICSQAQKEGIRLDFNQGLDIRLVNDKIAHTLSKTAMKDTRFALDYPGLIPLFEKKLKTLRKHMPNRAFMVYVLVGFNSTWEQDMERLEFLKANNCRPFLMRYETLKGNQKYMRLAEWVNAFHSFQKYTYDEYLKEYSRLQYNIKDYEKKQGNTTQDEKLF